MDEKITFGEWYKYNFVDNEIIAPHINLIINIYTEKREYGDGVMKTITPARIAVKLFAHLPIISVSVGKDYGVTCMNVNLYLDDSELDNEEEESPELFEDNE